MKIPEIKAEMCCYCGGCVAICPKDAIELIETRIIISAEKCGNCGLCKKFCPVGAIR
ncbi:MAG TPA: 4Fe-4S ferredoxin [Candidatus Altiarchaeales archaeon]|nr:MAG: 4Fe-4S ferredoxin [Candidatus Altiarchaeales archaeon]HDN83080.1 4Fe-4S ferredoxin [Candidatus Altiarchaeales archaeon]